MKWLPAFILLVLVSCSSSKMIETHLYFGQSKPTGGMVSDAEWTQFREKYINTVFSEGCTVVAVTGNWFDPDARKLITEPTYLVIHLFKPSKSFSEKVDSIRYWYKTLHQQQSVLRVDRKVDVSF